MKKTFLVLALALVLVLSFSIIAGAKYAGFDNDNSDGRDAYMKWNAANAAYARTIGDPAAVDPYGATGQGSAHGNYRTTTAKCFVCHSVHRAYASVESTSLASAYRSNRSLVNRGGGNACITCHATDAAGASTKQVEWGAANNSGLAGGPHNGFDCTGRCHSAGIHGWGTSQFHAMNVWMLGGNEDAEMHADFAAGNANSPFRRNWKDNSLGQGGGTAANGSITTTNFKYESGPTSFPVGQAGNNWFQNGTTGVPANGDVPLDIADGAANDSTIFAAAKATATGYTCNQTGCHYDSVFAINTWGFSRAKSGGPGYNNNNTSLADRQPGTAMTGHGTGDWGYPAHMPGCSPCHPGGSAGGYRYFPGPLNFGQTSVPNSSYTGIPFDGMAMDTPGQTSEKLAETLNTEIAVARTYGCDQCHDMVGVRTNTTAWPHGNRNIDVYEWTDFSGIVRDSNGQLPLDTWKKARVEVPVDRGNLWMYTGSISRITPAVQGVRTSDGREPMHGATAAAGSADNNAYLARTEVGPAQYATFNDSGSGSYWADGLRVADPVFSVIYGVAGSGKNGTAPNPARDGEVKDGSCLKCHVPTDAASAKWLVGEHNKTASVAIDSADIKAADIASRFHSARRETTSGWGAAAFTTGYTASRYAFLYK